MLSEKPEINSILKQNVDSFRPTRSCDSHSSINRQGSSNSLNFKARSQSRERDEYRSRSPRSESWERDEYRSRSPRNKFWERNEYNSQYPRNRSWGRNEFRPEPPINRPWKRSESHSLGTSNTRFRGGNRFSNNYGQNRRPRNPLQSKICWACGIRGHVRRTCRVRDTGFQQQNAQNQNTTGFWNQNQNQDPSLQQNILNNYSENMRSNTLN